MNKPIWFTAALAMYCTYGLAVDLGVGIFYAPGMAVGSAASSTELNRGGAQARCTVALSDRALVDVGYAFNNYTYGRWGSPVEEVFVVESIRFDVFTIGGDYALISGPWRPFAGGGVALARESAEAHGCSATDWYAGIYAGCGVRYYFAANWALAVGPRYTYLFDEPALNYDIDKPGELIRSEDHTQLVDFLFGLSYYF
jgi:opacity protein-like surface antigen